MYNYNIGFAYRNPETIVPFYGKEKKSMIVNLLVLVLLGAVVYFAAKQEKEEIEKTFEKRSKVKNSFIETARFWKKILENPIRSISLIVVLIFRRDPIYMIATIVIFFAIPFAFAYKAEDDQGTSLLRRINWNDPKTQKWATGILVVLAIISVINMPRRYVNSIVDMILGLAILIVAFIILELLKRRKS